MIQRSFLFFYYSKILSFKESNVNDWINYCIVALAFILPISRAGVSFFSILLILLWLYEGDFKKKWNQIFSSKVIIVLGLFIGFSLCSIIWSYELVDGLKYVARYWYFLVILVIATNLKNDYMKYVISAFLIAMFLSELISYGIFFEIIEWKNKLSSDPTPFMNHLQYSLFLAFTSLFLLNQILAEKNKQLRYFYIFFFLSVTINLFINGGRTGQLSFFVTLFIVGFLNIQNKVKAFFGMLFFGVFIIYIGYITSPNFKDRIDLGINDVSMMIQDNNFNGSIGIRIDMWMIGLDLIKENPVLGTGAGSEMLALRSEIQKYYPDKVKIIDLPTFHNDLIQILVQLGLVGGVLYLSTFYYILKLQIADESYSKTRFIFVVVFFVSSMFEIMFHAQFPMVLFTLFMGIFLAQNRIENKELLELTERGK